MENASKALLIAGGVLLTLIVLSLMVYMSSSVNKMAKAQDEKEETEQLVDFNNSYEAYHKSLMYGTDVITVYNKAQNSNAKNNFSIEIKILDKAGNEIGISYDKEFKNKVFSCDSVTGVHYNQNTGRIDQMVFTEQDVLVEKFDD